MNKFLSGVVFALGFVGTVVAGENSSPASDSSIVLPSVKRSPSDSKAAPGSQAAQQGTPAFSKKPSRSLSARLSSSNDRIPGQELRTPTPSQQDFGDLYFGGSLAINAQAPQGYQAPHASPASPYVPTVYTEQMPGVVNTAIPTMDEKRPARRIARKEKIVTEVTYDSDSGCCCTSSKRKTSQRVVTKIYQREGSRSR